MGRMSWTEWHETAEREAARTYGKKNAGLFFAMRFAGPAALVALAAAAGWGAWWLWNAAGNRDVSGGGGVSMGAVVAGLVLAALTVIGVRAGAGARRFSTVVILALAFGAAWLMFIGYAISSIL